MVVREGDVKFREEFHSLFVSIKESLKGVPWCEGSLFGKRFSWLWRPRLGLSRLEDEDMRTALIFFSYFRVAQDRVHDAMTAD
jgi:hypothetical protein